MSRMPLARTTRSLIAAAALLAAATLLAPHQQAAHAAAARPMLHAFAHAAPASAVQPMRRWEGRGGILG